MPLKPRRKNSDPSPEFNPAQQPISPSAPQSVGWLTCLFGLLLMSALTVLAAEPPRERLLMDFGWKFHLGNEWGIAQNLSKAGTGSGPANTWFSDATWRTVNLPHDWAIELPFDSNADGSHGFKALGPGFPKNSV